MGKKMHLPQMSALRFFSYGLVARDKERNESFIDVIPTEIRFTAQEDVDKLEGSIDIEYKITRGVDYVTQTIGNTIPAQWIDFNTNRITPPDVKKDDLVLIWRLGETDIYFWQDRNIANVKRLETVVYAFSADPKKPIKPDLSNAYYLMVGGHEGHITLKTSKANGEYCRFTHQINGMDGFIVTEDDLGNESLFDSKNTVIGFTNVNGTKFHLIKDTIIGSAPTKIGLSAKMINLDADKINLSAKEVGIKAPKVSIGEGDIEINNGKTIIKDLEAPKFKHGGPPCC